MARARRTTLIPRLVHQIWVIPVSGKTEIQVSWQLGTWMCSCDGFQRRRQPKSEGCSHITAVQQQLTEIFVEPLPTREQIIHRHWQL